MSKRKASAPEVVVKANETNPETIEVIAANVERLADGMQKILAGRLNSEALIILVAHASRVNRADVIAVINGIASLKKRYLK